jgi:hypothetical protein
VKREDEVYRREMSDTFYDRAAQGLPNFPREVVELWFEHVESEGWPPTLDARGLATGQWRERIFRDRPMAFWRSVSWSCERHPLALMSIEPGTRDMVSRLAEAFGADLPHPIDVPLAGASQRIREFVAILRQAGRLPRPPVLLATSMGFEVLDGFHRLAALAHAHNRGVTVERLHDAWVARPPTGAAGSRPGDSGDVDDLVRFLQSPEWAEIRRSMKGMDQRVGKKEIEGILLGPFLAARALVVGETLADEHAFSERPDFICSREDGSLVGVELAELTYGPDERITDEQAVELALHLIGKKEASRKSPEWECPDATVLAFMTAQRSIPEMRWLLDESVQAAFANHGFMEVWIADFTGYEAYGTIELFGLYSLKWWGHHKRPNANQKPYG